MIRPSVLISILIIIISQLNAGIFAWLPDTLVCSQTEMKLPVCVSSLQVSDSIVAYTCGIEYNDKYLSLLNVDETQSMVALWGKPTINSKPGQCTIAGFTSNVKGSQLIDTTLTWLYLNFWVVSDTSCTTEIRLNTFQVFPLSGEIQTDSVRDAEVNIIVNFPPEIPFLPGVNMLEDDSVTYNLMDYIHDRNDSWDELKIEIDPNPYMTIRLDPSGLMQIKPKLDWFGHTTLQLHVTDPHGTQVSGQIALHVLSVADPPSTFSLVHPANDTTLISSDLSLGFQWQASLDTDDGDEVKYQFYLSPDSLFRLNGTLYIPDIIQPEITINQNFNAGDYFWTVIAIDQDGLTQSCQDTFRFYIESLNPIQTVRQLFSFKLNQNCPNPFNSSTVLDFELDHSDVTNLDILNVQGQHVRTLIHQRLEAGSHTIQWHGKDDLGTHVPSGIYWAVLKTREKLKVIKICLIK